MASASSRTPSSLALSLVFGPICRFPSSPPAVQPFVSAFVAKPFEEVVFKVIPKCEY